MGIIVPELITPNGELLTNAYVSLNNSCVFTLPRKGQNNAMYAYASVYRSAATLQEAPVYQFELGVTNADVTRGPFMNMYEALYAAFPTGIKCQEPEDTHAVTLSDLTRESST